MDALFQQSGLLRNKWDEVHYADGATYGERTIERALDRVDEVYEPDGDSAGSMSHGTEPSSQSKAEDDGPEQTTSKAIQDESVYLEERNRLLQEKVRSQQTTIEEQAARIDELRAELETARVEVIEPQKADDTRSNPSSPWGRLKGWLLGA